MLYYISFYTPFIEYNLFIYVPQTHLHFKGLSLRFIVGTLGLPLNVYVKSTTRNRKSKIVAFEPIINELLSEDFIQIFYYKRILWQYLKRLGLMRYETDKGKQAQLDWKESIDFTLTFG